VWALYFGAQHYDHVGDQVKAVALIDRAIEHTPTVLELYVTPVD
jgi:peptide alpha-N-acetyltransferase